MASKYYLLFKTAPAEFKAWNVLEENIKEKIFPIIELTRGRKKPKSGKDIDQDQWPQIPGIYNFEGNFERVKETFGETEQVILDLTREEELTCQEITEISVSNNGYEKYINFLNDAKDSFLNLIPTLLINPSPGEKEDIYKKNLKTQLDSLMESFSGVAYRASILIDADFLYDLILLKDKINSYIEAKKGFWIILDHEFIQTGTGMLHALRTSKIIEQIYGIIPKAQIVVLATSFPRMVSEPEYDFFPMEEVYLFKELKNQNPNIEIFYGDYGSVNPLRNDAMGMGGWVPRIDFPTSKNKTIYHRQKRTKLAPKTDTTPAVYTPYGGHYINVANQLISNKLFENISESWGVKQIRQSAKGNPPGKAPAFWISVRMEIHILQQLKRLKLIP